MAKLKSQFIRVVEPKEHEYLQFVETKNPEFMFIAHTPLFSVYLAQPKILTYQRFDSKDLYIFVIAIS